MIDRERVLLVAAKGQLLDACLRHDLGGRRPVVFGAACGLIVAAIGVASGGLTFGSGYVEARAMLDGRVQLGVIYPLLKMASMVGSYLPGAPGGLIAPSLAVGAGIGNALRLIFDQMQLPVPIALGMVGSLAAVSVDQIKSVTARTSKHRAEAPLR